ncbi:MaoC family dehydratase [Allopusillimonas ginsengisoli]|uniref:MaoC family dehydratase n=1 Tax=Allopusillimonas ginsengisoli TaxID=453575 RepID=UPI001020C05D|nr:MaoC family dehydratase [Allopusillimonas ginsengisoli]TEA76919.1 MaoC family dehydratase [Allopusillimonas ginsengisoli]
MSGLYFDQFKIGDVFAHATTRTVTEADNLLATVLSMNPQPLHLDFEFAARTEFKKPLVNSMFTMALVIGLSVPETTLGTTIGNLGMKEVNFPKPVFAGDTIRVETTVVSKRVSKSRPNAGIVEFQHHGINQRGEIVCSCLRSAFMKREPEVACRAA